MEVILIVCSSTKLQYRLQPSEECESTIKLVGFELKYMYNVQHLNFTTYLPQKKLQKGISMLADKKSLTY